MLTGFFGFLGEFDLYYGQYIPVRYLLFFFFAGVLSGLELSLNFFSFSVSLFWILKMYVHKRHVHLFFFCQISSFLYFSEESPISFRAVSPPYRG